MALCIGSTTLRNVNPGRSCLSALSRGTLYLTNTHLRLKEFGFSSCIQSSFSRYLEQLVPRNPRLFAATAAGKADLESLLAEVQVTEAEEPDGRIRLRVEVPPAVCEAFYEVIIKEFTRFAQVPGFRAGKSVPERFLLDDVGKKNVQKTVVKVIKKRTLPHAMASVSRRPLKDSVRIITKSSDMEKSYSSLGSFSYDVIVDVSPEVKWVPEDGYKKLKIVVEIDSDINAEKACQEELKRLHKSLGVLKIVTDRGLQVGDVALLDTSATTIDKDESNVQQIPSAKIKGFQFDTEDSDKVLPGFLESILGMKSGETKAFPLTFPDSWRQEHLRGVNALFTVECKELFYRDLPELDDSLAEKLIPGCSSLEEVKETLLQKCRDQATDNAILDQLRKMVVVDIPRSLLEEKGRQLYGSQLLQMQATMKLSKQQLDSLSSPKAVNRYLEEQKENIISVIKQNLAVRDIFKRENLELPTEDLVKEVENIVEEFKRHKQEYDEDSVKEQVQEILEGAKVLEWLRERAEIQYITK